MSTKTHQYVGTKVSLWGKNDPTGGVTYMMIFAYFCIQGRNSKLAANLAASFVPQMAVPSFTWCIIIFYCTLDMCHLH